MLIKKRSDMMILTNINTKIKQEKHHHNKNLDRTSERIKVTTLLDMRSIKSLINIQLIRNQFINQRHQSFKYEVESRLKDGNDVLYLIF